MRLVRLSEGRDITLIADYSESDDSALLARVIAQRRVPRQLQAS